MTRLILKLVFVFGGQGVLAYVLYGCRVFSRASFHPAWMDSDLAVFGLPLVVGFALAALVLFPSFSQLTKPKRIAAALGLSAVGATISSFIGVVIGFNMYGT